MLSQHSQKNLSRFTIFEPCFCLVSEKTFALHNLLKPKNCFLEALWKQILCIFLYISVRKFLFHRCSKILSVEGWAISLRAACCLSLVKCFTIFYFKWNLEIQPFFSISILPSIALKCWNCPYNFDLWLNFS